MTGSEVPESETTGPRRRRWLKPVAALLILVLALASFAGWYGRQRYLSGGPLAAPATLVIPRGAGMQAIAEQLVQAGIVRNRTEVLVAARLRGSAHRLRAGEYAFDSGISLRGVLDLLESGRTVVRRITIPEGLTSRQVLALLNAEPAMSGTVETVPPDGSLLPETYHYAYGDTRAEIVARMQAGMRTALDALWSDRAPDLPVRTAEDAVILASIIEKETGVAAERAKVAGVFVNRLRIGMRLQSDPTVIFALTDGSGELGRALTRADWRFESPYNTYVADGLPPGPIANPGRDSLQAALNPERHDYLYFVADGSGGHAFSKTLEGHNRNVAQWRRFQREQGAAADDD